MKQPHLSSFEQRSVNNPETKRNASYSSSHPVLVRGCPVCDRNFITGDNQEFYCDDCGDALDLERLNTRELYVKFEELVLWLDGIATRVRFLQGFPQVSRCYELTDDPPWYYVDPPPHGRRDTVMLWLYGLEWRFFLKTIVPVLDRHYSELRLFWKTGYDGEVFLNVGAIPGYNEITRHCVARLADKIGEKLGAWGRRLASPL
jgi:hypothetical protein